MGNAAMVQEGAEISQVREERGTLKRRDIVDLEEMKKKGEQELEKGSGRKWRGGAPRVQDLTSRR